LYDSPSINSLNSIPKTRINKTSDGYFRLFHAGALASDRKLNLDKVIEAIQDIDGVKLIVAGYGDVAEVIKELSKKMPSKIEFLGKISYGDVIENGIKSDLFFVLRDPVVPANRYTCGSTLFNAMICGKPILANIGSSTATKVSQEDCGIVVDANDIEEIKMAIIRLKNNPDLRLKLGLNAKNAYLETYNWGIMENRLVGLYQQTLEK
jgi:glycosyltransferase involved in cell wall biosynthesis